jgi:hypothetical protein
MQSTQLSSNAILLCFKLENQGIYSQSPSILISVDLWLDGDYPSVIQLLLNSGFKVCSTSHELTFICRSYPLVRNVSSYWFGAYNVRSSHNWTQITDNEVSGIDTGATISWQEILIPSGRSLTRSIIVKFGPFSSGNTLELSLTFPQIPSTFTGYEELLISGTVTISSWNYKILTMIDNDVFTLSIILDWCTVYSSSSSISFSLFPAVFDIYTTDHQFAFYAVNEYGDVSSPQFLYLSGTPIGDDNWENIASTEARSPAFDVDLVDNTGVGIGVTVGVTVFAVIIAVGGAMFCRLKKQRPVANV